MAEQQRQQPQPQTDKSLPEDMHLRQVSHMLSSQHEATQAMGASKFKELVKEDVTAALRANVLQHLVSMIKADDRNTRAAAAAALAVLSAYPLGRDAARVAGALPLLVLLLEEGPQSPAAEHAAKALMNAAVSDTGKDTIHRNGGVPSLLQLLCEGSKLGLQQEHFHAVTGERVAAPVPAAVYAVGAISNMLQAQCKKITNTMQQVDGLNTLQTVGTKHQGNVLGIRAQMAASMLRKQLQAEGLGRLFKAGAAAIVAAKVVEVAGTPATPAPAGTASARLVTTSPSLKAVNIDLGQPAPKVPAATTAEKAVAPLLPSVAAIWPATCTTAEQLAEQLVEVTAKPKARKKSPEKRAVVREPINGLADVLAELGTVPGVDPVRAVGVTRIPMQNGSLAAKQAGSISGSNRRSAGKLGGKRVSISESVKFREDGQDQSRQKAGSNKWAV